MSNKSTSFDTNPCDLSQVVTNRRQYKPTFNRKASKASKQWVFGAYVPNRDSSYTCDCDWDHFDIHDIIKKR